MVRRNVGNVKVFFYYAALLRTSGLFLQSNSKTSIYEKGQKAKTKGNTL